MESKDLKWVYDTVLSAPGMEDVVKLDFKISRKLVLLLAQVVERGLAVKGEGLIECVDKSLLSDLQSLADSSIEKAGLTTLCKKLKREAS
jgi:hypothetical protein